MTYEDIKNKYFTLLPSNATVQMSVAELISTIQCVLADITTQEEQQETPQQEQLETPNTNPFLLTTLADYKHAHPYSLFEISLDSLNKNNVTTFADVMKLGKSKLMRLERIGPYTITKLSLILEEHGLTLE